jgi:hypothetical protein
MFCCWTAVQIASASLVSFFCRAYEGLHVLRRHDLNCMTELLEPPLPIECTSRSFDADEARL